MERRLIRRLESGPSEGPVLAGPEVRMETLERNRRIREQLAYETGLPAVRNAVKLAENPEALRTKISRNFEDVPLHVNAIAADYALRLPPGRQQAILDGINAGEALSGDLAAIMEAVTTPVETGTGEDIEHRYLRAKEAPEGFPSWYGIDFRKVEADKRIVAGLRAANPSMAADLADVEQALAEYARPDPSLPSDRWGLVRRNAGDSEVLGMARFAAIIVAASAAVLTGVMAIGRKEGFKAPLLYAGIAGLLAFPELRRSIFGSQADNILAEVDQTVNARDFKENVRTYDVAGPEWSAFADDVMHNSGDTRQFLRQLARHPVDSPDNAEAIDEYVSGVMPDGEGRAQLRRMILENRFPAFAERLMSARNEDARDVVREYIGRGAGRFEHMAERSAGEVNALFENAPKQYLDGSFNAPEFR